MVGICWVCWDGGSWSLGGSIPCRHQLKDRRPIVYRVLAIPTGKDDSTELNYSVRKDNATGLMLGLRPLLNDSL